MIRIITLLMAVLFVSVGSAQKKRKPDWADNYVVKEKPRVSIKEVEPFLEANQYVITHEASDYNGDTLIDVIAVIGDKKEEDNYRKGEKDIRRPIIILKRNASGTLELMHKNDRVVYCYRCESPYGSPLTSIAFDGNRLEVQHEAGKSNRWTRVITFEYDRELELWFLVKDAKSLYNITNANGREAEVRTQDDFGFITFEKTDIFEEDLRKKK